jgi:hypothetical protein
MIFSSVILTSVLVATANAASMSGSSETNALGSYEDGLHCDFEYHFDNDLKCTPSTMLCSFNNGMWMRAMYGLWCDPEIAQDHLPLGEFKKLFNITNIPLVPLLARIKKNHISNH